MNFALYFGNRKFMPECLIEDARNEMAESLAKNGYEYIMTDKDLTRFGAVESREEGKKYNKWLREHLDEVDGIIVCMPIFIDENGLVAALEGIEKPIFLQAYPDEIGKMSFSSRRDAYCGKFSATDVLEQYRIPYSIMRPHVVHPLSKEFEKNLNWFAGVCRVVNGMRKLNVGVIGARTTAFKTVRYDEITCQRHGINIESFDLSELIYKVKQMGDDDELVEIKKKRLQEYADFTNVPTNRIFTLAKIGVVIDEYIEEYSLDAITLRCWNELETELRVCPCVLLSELNDRNITASCEVDLCSAITMKALSLATENPATCLDWNNNYGEHDNKVILFHCGPVPQSLMSERGKVTTHKMFEKVDEGSGWGTNEGRIASFDMTYSNCKTEDGKIYIYFSEGKMTDDSIEKEFFGCGGVANIPYLEEKLLKLARNGFKHHTTLSRGHVKTILEEAFRVYLGYQIVDIDEVK